MVAKRRRRSSAWNWAVSSSVTVVDTTGGTGQFAVATSLLPAERIDWLLQSGRGRNHLTVTGILLWLQFAVVNTTSNFLQLQPEVNFAVRKYTKDNAGFQAPEEVAPYTMPTVPSAVTSWTSSSADEEDGLDPYMWTHACFPNQFPGGYMQGPVAPVATGLGADGQYYIAAGGSGGEGAQLVYPSEHAVQAWQPSVHIRTRRRLMKGEGCAMYINLPSAGYANELAYQLSFRARVLTT